MKDEIKEILDRLEKIGFYANVPKELVYMTTNITPQECKTLLDYITNLQKYYNDNVNEYEELIVKYSNLQEENENLKEEINNIIRIEITKKELQEENERLKELNVCVGCNNNPDYKSRIEKAIEYIKNGLNAFEKIEDKELISNRMVDIECFNDLLNILQGVNDV